MTAVCEFCHANFELRRQGRRQRFCKPPCRRAFYKEARRIGAKAFRRRAKKSSKPRASDDELIIRYFNLACRALQRKLAKLLDPDADGAMPHEPPPAGPVLDQNHHPVDNSETKEPKINNLAGAKCPLVTRNKWGNYIER